MEIFKGALKRKEQRKCKIRRIRGVGGYLGRVQLEKKWNHTVKVSQVLERGGKTNVGNFEARKVQNEKFF